MERQHLFQWVRRFTNDSQAKHEILSTRLIVRELETAFTMLCIKVVVAGSFDTFPFAEFYTQKIWPLLRVNAVVTGVEVCDLCGRDQVVHSKGDGADCVRVDHTKVFDDFTQIESCSPCMKHES